MHDLGAEAGQFEHLIIGNLLELARAGNDARIRRINSIHVRINLAKIGLERGGHGNGGQVRTTASQGGDLPFHGLALKARDNDDVAIIKQRMNLLGRDVLNLGFGMDAVRNDAGLSAGQ